MCLFIIFYQKLTFSAKRLTLNLTSLDKAPAQIIVTSAFGASASASAYGGAQEQTSHHCTCNRLFSIGRARKFNG